MYLREDFILYSDGFLRYFDCDVSSVCRVHRIFTECSQKISTQLLTVLIIRAIVQLEQRKREIERDKEIKKSFPSGLTQVPKKETGKQQLRF